MFEKIPLWRVEDNFLVTTKGSLVWAFEVYLHPVDAVGEREAARDVDAFTSFFRGIAGNEGKLCFSIISENVEVTEEDLKKFLQLHSAKPLTRKVAEERARRHLGRVMRKAFFVFEYLVFRDLKEFMNSADYEVKFEAAREEVERIEKAFVDFYFSQFFVKPRRLTGFEMWQHLFKMINPLLPAPEKISLCKTPREQLFLADVDTCGSSEDYVFYNGRYYATVVVDFFPPKVLPLSGSELFLKLSFPCRMVASCMIPNQVEVREKLSSVRRTAGIFVSRRKGNPDVERNKKKVEAIDELMESEKETVVISSVFFSVSDETRKGLYEKISQIQSKVLLSWKESACFVNRRKKVKHFASSLGYFPSYSSSVEKNYTTLKAFFYMAPFRGDFVGTVEEPVMLFSTRRDSVAFLTLKSKRQNRWSFLVIAPTGRGKSFLVNHFLMSLFHSNPLIVIFDLAPMSSYRTLVELYGGEYVEIKPSRKGSSRNVFDFPLGYSFPDEKKFAFLDTFFSYLLSERGIITKEELELLRRAVKRTYEKLLKETQKMIPEDSRWAEYSTWVNLREEMLELALREAEKGNLEKRDRYLAVAEMAHRIAMPVLEDLSSTLASDEAVNMTESDRKLATILRRRLLLYIDGPARRLFGVTTSFRTSANFVVANLGFLRESLELLVPTYMVFREYFWERMAIHFDEVPGIMKRILGEDYFVEIQTKTKFFIIDEYHNFNASREIIQLTDKDFRQTRTYGIGMGVVTQSLKDIIYEGADEKFSIFESAANKFFLCHTTPENPQHEVIDYVVKKTGMSKKDRELFMSLNMVPGKYSEFLYMGEAVGKGVLKYEVTPVELWINTTHKAERYVRDALIEKFVEMLMQERVDLREREKEIRGEVVAIVVSYLAEKYPEGLSGLNEDERVKVFQECFNQLRERFTEQFLR